MMTTNLEGIAPNVVSLESAIQLREEKLRFSAYVDYLNVLKTEEILVEIKELIKLMDNNQITRDLLVKGKLVLSEVSSRLSQSSPLMGQAVKTLQKELENKIKDLEKFFVIKL